MPRKWSASCPKCDVFLSDGHPDGPGYLPSRSGREVGRGANDFAAPFAGTVRQDCLDHLKQPLTAMPQRSPANPESTPKIGNCPPQYGQRLPMCFSMDALTVARVHRFEVIQKVARRL